MKKWLAKGKNFLAQVRDFLDEKAIRSVNSEHLPRVHQFAHFWLLVWRSFVRNRCPVRASALAYTTLLALIPMLFVGVSVSSGILKKQGAEGVNQFIDRIISAVVPPVPPDPDDPDAGMTTVDTANPGTTAAPTAWSGRKQFVEQINGFIQNIQPASLGITGVALLVFVAISMIARIEDTFNDIWGVSKGRSFISQIIHYWSAITLGAVLLALAAALTGGPHFQSTRAWIAASPFIANLVFKLLPIMFLCMAFTTFYMLMPNTRVHFRAAFSGGVAAAFLWTINGFLSSLYVSRVVSNSKIYGSLFMIPVFMIGLYLSWLILLFGAQVAYAFQNRAAYLQEKLSENVNQRGREFIALRLMQCVGQRFLRGERPATVPEMADALLIPTRLVQKIMQTLLAAGLVVEATVEVAGRETAYSPARPLEAINCHDILLALRAGQGQELATRDDPARVEVYGDFERILEAERKTSSAVTVFSMATRAEELNALPGNKRKAMTEGKSDKS